jgi:GntR family transcriptional regulator
MIRPSPRSRSTEQPRLLHGMRLDPRNSLPLHAQAEQSLRTLLANPANGPGTLLPDEVSLANAMGVSRNTLRAAIVRLVSEGKLERRAGVGTRVLEPKVHSGVGAWQSFSREMESKGVKVETFSVSARRLIAPTEVARRLHLDEGTEVLCLDRIRGWDGHPVVRFRSYLHQRLKLKAEDDFSQPLYEMIRSRCGVIADHSEDALTAIARTGGSPAHSESAWEPLCCKERVACTTHAASRSNIPSSITAATTSSSTSPCVRIDVPDSLPYSCPPASSLSASSFSQRA